MNKRIRRGYDFLARFYDGLAFALFGNRLNRCKTALLNKLPAANSDTDPLEHALIVGGGTGFFLEAFLNSVQARRVLFTDLSPAMTERARRRAVRVSHPNTDLKFRATDILELPGTPAFDLVCTNFFLDSFAGDELRRIMRHIHCMLKPGGRWYFSDFQGGPRPLIALLYTFFRLVCRISARNLPDYPAEFRRLNLALEHECWSSDKMLRTAIYRKGLNTRGN